MRTVRHNGRTSGVRDHLICRQMIWHCLILAVVHFAGASLGVRRVYTYFEGEHGNTPAQLGVWTKCWKEAGFDPFVLNETHAQAHPQYPSLKERLMAMPTVNPKHYEMSCFLRHLAMAQIGGGYMVDYDVIPVVALLPTLPQPGNYTVHGDGGFVPSFVSGKASEYLRVIRLMAAMNVTNQREFSHKGKPHISDMHAMRRLATERRVLSRTCVALPSPSPKWDSGFRCDVPSAPPPDRRCLLHGLPIVLHFSHDSFSRGVWGVGLLASRDRGPTMNKVFEHFIRNGCLRGHGTEPNGRDAAH